MISLKHLQKMNNAYNESNNISPEFNQHSYPIQNKDYNKQNHENDIQKFNSYLTSQKSQKQEPQQIQESPEDKPKPELSHQMSFQPQQSSGEKQQSTSHLIKNTLRVIFMFYSSFGDRQNTTFLKSNKFIKLLSDANIIPSLMDVKNCDILYHQSTKHTQTLTLQQFQQLLPKLALIGYPDVRVHQGLLRLYTNHFQDLFEKIMSFTEFGEQMQQINHTFEDHFILLIQPISRILTKIHQNVFFDQSQKPAKVQWQYIQFLTGFDLLPALLNQSQAQLLFSDLCSRTPPPSLYKLLKPFEKQGKYIFTIYAFVESLIIIGLMQPTQSEQEQLSQMKNFRFMLERMESSDGFQKFHKSQSRTQSEEMQLVNPVDRILNPINSDSRIKNSNSSLKKSRLSSEKQQESRVAFSPQQSHTVDQTEPQLKTIFEHYASLGEPLNITYLKGFKFNKLLLHAKILNECISSIDTDIIYVKLTGPGWISQYKHSQLKHNTTIHSPSLEDRNQLYYAKQQDFQNGKMNFTQFLKSLEMIAEKCFSNNPNGVTYLVEQHLLPLEKSIKTEKHEQILQVLVELLQDEQILYLFSLMQQGFDASQMDLNAFMKFCIEFELSNCLISQAHLLQIFYALSQLTEQQNSMEGSRIKSPSAFKTKSIDKHQFVEAISIIAILVYQHEPSMIKRIIYLLERMNDSQGALKTQKQIGLTRNPQGYKWDLVQSIHQAFLKSDHQKANATFDEIVQQGLDEQSPQ